MTELKISLTTIKSNYLHECGEVGGTSIGFRTHVLGMHKRSPEIFEQSIAELLCAAAIQAWQQPPRDNGPDLFSLAGHQLPETITRYSAKNSGLATGHDDFEKVHIDFATVADLFDDADIKMVKASEAQTAALARRRCAEAALKRAGGNRGRLLKDLADAPLTVEADAKKPS